MTIARRIAAVVAGLVIAFAIVMAFELIPHHMYPPPAGMNMNDVAQVKPYVASLPATAFAIVLLGHLIGTIAGTSVAAGIARDRRAAYVLGTLLFVAGIMNAITIPQPVWFSAASFAIYVIGTLIGARLAAPRVRSQFLGSSGSSV
jgi:hypothetical protein